MPFPYDWRQSLTTARVRRCATKSRKIAADRPSRRSCRFVCWRTPMGGPVVRTMLADEKGAKTWDAHAASNRVPASSCWHAERRFIRHPRRC